MPSTKSNVCTKWCQNCLSEEVTVDNLFVLVDAAVRGLEAERRLGNFDFFDSRWWKLLLKFDPKIRSHELNRLALPASLLSPRRSSAIMHKSSRSLTSAGLARDSGKAQWKREAMKEECTRSEKFVRWERQKWSINLEMDELDDARGTWLYAFESSLEILKLSSSLYDQIRRLVKGREAFNFNVVTVSAQTRRQTRKMSIEIESFLTFRNIVVVVVGRSRGDIRNTFFFVVTRKLLTALLWSRKFTQIHFWWHLNRARGAWNELKVNGVKMRREKLWRRLSNDKSRSQ